MERVTSWDSGSAGPVNELPWLWRKLAILRTRGSLRKHPVEGLLGVDPDGRRIWADGYPKTLMQRYVPLSNAQPSTTTAASAGSGSWCPLASTPLANHR